METIQTILRVKLDPLACITQNQRITLISVTHGPLSAFLGKPVELCCTEPPTRALHSTHVNVPWITREGLAIF